MPLKLIALERKPKSLDQLELRGEQIDKGIERLVKALQFMGLPTYSSCEGHIGDDRHPYPWVTIAFFNGADPKAIDVLNEKIRKYNDRSQLPWQVIKLHSNVKIYQLLPMFEAANRVTLEMMQKNCEMLAESLFFSETMRRKLTLHRKN